VVLLSGGVGLTPLVSMLHALAAGTDRRVTFIHACDDGDVHALRQEVLSLAATRAGIASHFCYRFPSEADAAAAHFDSHGVVSRELLQRLLPLDDYDFYLCGPPAFMQAVYRLLRGLGVAKPRIAYEFFGPATVLEDASDSPGERETGRAGDLPVAPAASPTIAVTFRKSGRSEPWNEASGSLLAFAESLGLEPAFSCRAGICSTCKTRLVEGEVTYVEEPLDDPGPGEVLVCCAKPVCSVVLDL
jgi:ferredoxin